MFQIIVPGTVCPYNLLAADEPDLKLHRKAAVGTVLTAFAEVTRLILTRARREGRALLASPVTGEVHGAQAGQDTQGRGACRWNYSGSRAELLTMTPRCLLHHLQQTPQESGLHRTAYGLSLSRDEQAHSLQKPFMYLNKIYAQCSSRCQGCSDAKNKLLVPVALMSKWGG